MQELGHRYGLHPNVISNWRKQALTEMPNIFERSNKKSAEDREVEAREESMLKTIGQQKIEIDFLKKKYRQLYGRDPQ